MNTTSFAEKLASNANSVSVKVLGIGTLLPFIMILLPLLIDCFKPADGSEVKKFLEKRFDAKTGKFVKRDVDRMAIRVKQAMEKGGGLIAHSVAREMGIETMMAAKDCSATELSLIINENRRA